MNLWKHIKRPPWRTILLLLGIICVVVIAYFVWSPGQIVRDGRHDLETNGIWLQHGWLGDDRWFTRNRRDKNLFRDPNKIRGLADLLSENNIKYVFPHLCPCDSKGNISSVDHAQTEQFLDYFEEFEVIPWIGGILDEHCFPESEVWRKNFISSVQKLMEEHTRLAGVQLNIEPMPSGNKHFIILLKELRERLPRDKIISVAAYPPPTWWHPFPEIHWEEDYYRKISSNADQLAVMMYDTALRYPKLYKSLMSSWTKEVLEWSENSEVLLGVPVYDDAGVGYHYPKVENLENSLAGIHAGLAKFKTLPANYCGIAIYCEWEMDKQEWDYMKENFRRTSR